MSKNAIFPYGISLKESGEVDTFPAAKVFFPVAKGEEVSLFLIIDSGARISALPRSDAKRLGIAVDERTPLFISGVGGEVLKGWKNILRVRLGKNELSLPFVFIDGENAPRILGREGIFENFSIIFEESKRRSGFLGKQTKEDKNLSIILDKVEKST